MSFSHPVCNGWVEQFSAYLDNGAGFILLYFKGTFNVINES